MANQPTSWVTYLPSVAAILQAIAWPLAVTVLFFVYKSKISALLEVITNKLATATKLKAWQFELESKEQAVKEVLDETGRTASSETQGDIPKRQIVAAGEVFRLLRDGSFSERGTEAIVRRQIQQLSEDYENLRIEMPRSSQERTRKMNEIAAKMRALALASHPLLHALVSSKSSGERLAAICILQVVPEPDFSPWLIERIKNEDQPFIFFQASVAVLNLVKDRKYSDLAKIKQGIMDALQRVSSFKGGVPDQNTIDVLNLALSQVE